MPPQSESVNPGERADSDCPLLAARGIHKSFGGVQALRGVDLEVRRGEVHAVCGENGAGKSTLMHILAGVHRPDAGSISLHGREVHLENEHAAQRLGIGMVYQERSLALTLTVAENIFAGRQPVKSWGRMDWGELWAAAADVLARLELKIDPRTLVSSLSPAQQQMVEIARALSLKSQLLILDEPTSALTSNEVSALFRVIRGRRDEGAGIVYISHRLEELFYIADRATVLKDGEFRGTFGLREATPDDLISAMVGRPLERRAGSASPQVGSSAPPV